MQNLWRFIVKYSSFLIFLCLEVASFLLFFSSQPYPKSTMLSSSNAVIAWLNEGVSGIGNFFSLSKANRELAVENALLLQENHILRSLLDSSLSPDSADLPLPPSWVFRPAKVVDLETKTQHNYLVLNRGLNDSVHIGDGVICSSGIVGMVSNCNSGYSLVTPIIHPKMNISCRLKEVGYAGFLHWQGPSCHYAQLTDIARHITVNKGDTVITSGITTLYPEGLMIGVVDETELKDGDTYHYIRVRLTTDFRSLRYVQVVSNPLAEQQNEVKTQSR